MKESRRELSLVRLSVEDVKKVKEMVDTAIQDLFGDEVGTNFLSLFKGEYSNYAALLVAGISTGTYVTSYVIEKCCGVGEPAVVAELVRAFLANWCLKEFQDNESVRANLEEELASDIGYQSIIAMLEKKEGKNGSE